MIFVFGSNLRGLHGAGAARYAWEHYGAVMGVGEGLTGQSYALPTCSAPGVPLSLEDIKMHVDEFLKWAKFAETALPGEHILVTRVGCGFAGYTDAEIAPMFVGATSNVWLPAEWFNLAWEANKAVFEAAQKVLQREREG